MPTKQQFYNIQDVMRIIGRKETSAKNLIRQLNAELEAKGYITFRGKVSVKYFHERVMYDG